MDQLGQVITTTGIVLIVVILLAAVTLAGYLIFSDPAKILRGRGGGDSD